jgi:hypothetical protein
MADQIPTTGSLDCFGYLRWTQTSCRSCGYERADCTCPAGFIAPVKNTQIKDAMIQTTVRTPPERIVRSDHLLTIYNPDVLLKECKRFVDLACGHKAITSAVSKAVCPRCTEMLRRSIKDGSEDWDAFRNHGARDEMAWPADPMRQFNEPTDLSGNFLRE